MLFPLNDLIVVQIIDEKDDFPMPDKAKGVQKAKIIAIGSNDVVVQGGIVRDKWEDMHLEVGTVVAYRRSVEDRQQNPAVRTRLDDGTEVMLISIFDLLFKI